MEANTWQARCKEALFLSTWSFFKVPMLFWIRPKVELVTDEEVRIAIPLTRRTKNHLGSMYFGALACGADIACGYIAMKKIHASGRKVSLVFKDLKAEFLRRPTSKTVFVCAEGKAIEALVAKAIAHSERVEGTFPVRAYCLKEGAEPVAEFWLTLSLKRKD